jgi:hypothetical protein
MTSPRRRGLALRGGAADEGLDRRERAILRSVIREHIHSGEPIGSRTISRGPRLDLSPASVRSIMADLEARGFLTQPHASAGRLPTAKAYRMYVDRLMERQRVGPQQTAAIERALFEARGEVADVLAEACHQLSRFSNQVGLVLAPALERVVVEHVEFVRLDEERIVAILVGRSGVVHNRILRVEESFEQAELDQIGRYLSEEFRGHALTEIREILRQRMSEERALYDRLMAAGPRAQEDARRSAGPRPRRAGSPGRDRGGEPGAGSGALLARRLDLWRGRPGARNPGNRGADTHGLCSGDRPRRPPRRSARPAVLRPRELTGGAPGTKL